MTAATPISPTVRLATAAMGTRFEILLAGGPPHALRAAGEEAIEEIERWHARLSRFQRPSLVTLLNDAGGLPVRLDRQTYDLFALAEAVRIASGGAFDISAGSGALALDPEGSAAALQGPGAAVDLGAIAKGHAIDLAADILRDHGVTSALLHGGSSTVAAIGARPDGAPWRVVVEGPSGVDPRTIELTDRCLSVSSDAAQGPHIVDPRTGRPAPGPAVAVCVHPSAALTDAWSTALYVDRRCPEAPGVAWMIWHAGAWHGDVKGR